MLQAKLKSIIQEQALWQSGQHILVGVSGGADSVALLHLLHGLAPSMRLRLTVAHLQHGIRGADAAGDARFVSALAQRLKLAYVERRVDVPRLAKRQGISLEMAGRQARYAFFAAAARRRQCHLAATAHTSNDHAETILMNLARGAGPQGLAGIPRVMRWGSLVVVRPLRDIERGALLRFLKQRRLTWREDLSNADASFLRNRVRHEVLPFLEQKLNPRIRPALIHMAAILEKENAWLDKLARDLLADLSSPAGLNTGRLSAQPQGARRRILRLWLMAQGFTAASLDFELVERLDGWLLSSARGRALTLPGGRLARQAGQELRLESSQPPAPFCIPLKIPGSTHLPQLGLRVNARVAPGTRRVRPPGMGHYPVQASLALKAWRRRRVVVRSWQAGDRMAPLGLDGSKKVQDIFTDAKVPRAERQRLPLFVCGDEIIWIPGYRIARAWATGTAQEQALQLTLKRVGRARPAAAQGCAARARCTARR